MVLKILLTFILLVAQLFLSALADFRYYEAPADRSRWQLESNPVLCQLKHRIPLYGTAVFSSKASKQQNLGFTLLVDHQLPLVEGQAMVVRSQAPAWRHNAPTKHFGEVGTEISKKVVTIQQALAWQLLTELEQGMFPTFYHADWNSERGQVAVGVSAVNFLPGYNQFLACLGDLLPYDFNDIANTTIHFDFDRHTFNKSAREKLARIKAYLNADPGLEVAIVLGHTDNKGGRWYNKKLGEKRALAVRDYLVSAGAEKDKIKIVSHGERKPVASNRTRRGRALNRRVLIKMQK